ncbi:MAG TPA: restriction endonuclease subunit S [Desulfuromonadales bacterium]|nr:restriction endonuclease subunit S [Desulfuromonadales bacterium]
MGSERRSTKLSDVLEIIGGGTPNTQTCEYWGGTIPWLSVVDFNNGFRWVSETEKTITQKGLDCSSTTLLRKGDIIISARGTVGAIAQLAKAMAFNQSCYGLRAVADKADTNFLYYAIHKSVDEMKRLAHGAVFDTITRSTFESLEIQLPPIPEQRAIAHILGTLDDKIELNRQMNETLEAMARALFKSWFVDFEPVRAKVKGRATGLPKEIANLFTDSFEDSELGEVPKGWRVGALADLASLNPESWSKETRPDFISYVDLSNTKWGRIEATSAYTVDEAPSRAQRVLRPKDTILGTVRPGNGSYAFIAEDGLTGSTGFAVLRPKGAINAEYVYLAATSSENIESLAHLADGGAYPAVRPEVVSATKVILPCHSVLTKFSQITAPLFEKMGQNNNESQTLAAQRDTLLPKLLSGEVRVKDVEQTNL